MTVPHAAHERESRHDEARPALTVIDGGESAKPRAGKAEFARMTQAVVEHPKLSDRGKVMYAELLLYAWRPGRPWSPSQDTLASDLGWTVSKVRRAIADLAEAGLVEVETTWRKGLKARNTYTLREAAGRSDRAFLRATSDDRADTRGSDRANLREEVEELEVDELDQAQAPVVSHDGAAAIYRILNGHEAFKGERGARGGTARALGLCAGWLAKADALDDLDRFVASALDAAEPGDSLALRHRAVGVAALAAVADAWEAAGWERGFVAGIAALANATDPAYDDDVEWSAGDVLDALAAERYDHAERGWATAVKPLAAAWEALRLGVGAPRDLIDRAEAEYDALAAAGSAS